MTSNQIRPQRCETCHSNRIIPIIQGNPDRVSHVLDLQGKIAHGGSFEICNGVAIWACADCSDNITDEAYLFDESNQKLIQAYRDAINDAFDSFEMIDDAEFRKLMGLDLLCIFSKLYLNNRFFELEKTEESFLILNCDGSKLEDFNMILTSDRFCQIDEYLGEEKTKEFSIRIDKEECMAVATRVSLGKIQIKRK